jgi:hypothetical protein
MVPSYAEPLRVVGQWLDHTLADEVELITTEHTLTVRWRRKQGIPDLRTFDWSELREISESARQQRKNPFGRMTGRWAPVLRTLAQELDSQGVELLLVRSLAGGLQVYGVKQERAYTQWFSLGLPNCFANAPSSACPGPSACGSDSARCAGSGVPDPNQPLPPRWPLVCP